MFFFTHLSKNIHYYSGQFYRTRILRLCRTGERGETRIYSSFIRHYPGTGPSTAAALGGRIPQPRSGDPSLHSGQALGDRRVPAALRALEVWKGKSDIAELKDILLRAAL
jgi:hypothetical protein